MKGPWILSVASNSKLFVVNWILQMQYNQANVNQIDFLKIFLKNFIYKKEVSDDFNFQFSLLNRGGNEGPRHSIHAVR